MRDLEEVLVVKMKEGGVMEEKVQKTTTADSSLVESVAENSGSFPSAIMRLVSLEFSEWRLLMSRAVYFFSLETVI